MMPSFFYQRVTRLRRPMLLWTPVDIHVWRGSVAQQIDDVIASSHDTQSILVPWDTYRWNSDNIHLTDSSFVIFIRDLLEGVLRVVRDDPTRASPLLIISDSSVDYYDGGADTIEDIFAARGIECRVRAVCGSGFVQRSDEGYHFLQLLRDACADGFSPAHILVIGGWNDISTYSSDIILPVVRRFCNTSSRILSVGTRGQKRTMPS